MGHSGSAWNARGELLFSFVAQSLLSSLYQSIGSADITQTQVSRSFVASAPSQATQVAGKKKATSLMRTNETNLFFLPLMKHGVYQITKTHVL